MVRIRINDIECRLYKTTQVSEPFYEIVKWQPNPYYNKLQEYLDNGYVESKDGSMIQKDNMGLSKGMFTNPESCYTIAHLELDMKEFDTTLKSIGSRLLDLTEDERIDFFEAYKISNDKLYKKYFQNE
jgi:hypothetical protein